MRIRGGGGGYGGETSGGSGGRDRAQAFRRGRSPGEKVRGRVLRYESAGRCWVEIEGQILLADIAVDVPVGTYLLFSIESLEPEIRLKTLGEIGQGGPTLSPRARDFLTGRASFDDLFAGLPGRATLTGGFEVRVLAFLTLVKTDKKVLAAYLACRDAAEELSRNLSERGQGRFDFAPWLAPDAREHELYLASGESGESLLRARFVAPGLGQCEIQAATGPDTHGFRLLAENPAEDAAKTLLAGLALPGQFAALPLLGLAKLAPASRGPAFFAGLFPNERPGGTLNVRV